jgi:hypothetical protein
MAVLTTTGKQWIVDKMRSINGTPIGNAVVMQYIHWGTGSTAEAVGNTALHVAGSEARVAGVITSPSAALHRVIGTLTADGAKTITEVGLFDATATGTMLMRALFTGIPLVVGDQIQFTLDFTQT